MKRLLLCSLFFSVKNKTLKAIKFLFLGITLWYLFDKIYPHRHRFQEDILLQAAHESLLFPLLCLLLVIPNWWLESLKWKRCMHKVEQITWKESFMAVLSGVSWGLFSPNRTGEFIGRLAFVPKGKRLDAITLHMALSFTQQSITFFGGLIPAALFFRNHHLPAPWIWMISGLLILLMLILLFRDSLLVYLQPVAAHVREVLYRFSRMDWMFYTFLSFCRYSIFVLQYFLLLKFFGMEISFGEALPLIALNFFLVSLIPSFALSEIGVRGAVAMLIFSNYLLPPTLILSASLTLWIFNLGIPALLGIGAFLQHKVDA
jgi:hypothetical protein